MRYAGGVDYYAADYATIIDADADAMAPLDADMARGVRALLLRARVDSYCHAMFS